MTAPATLADAWDDYAADLPRDTPAVVRVKLKRAGYAMALFAAARCKAGPEARDALIAEAVQFGRAIGSAAESAT